MEFGTKNKISLLNEIDIDRLSKDDLLAIIKTSHIISESESIKYAASIYLKFAIEKTGAERGLLFTFSNRDIKTIYALPSEKCDTNSHPYAQSIIDIIFQNKVSLVINAVSSDRQFCSDPYLTKYNIKSTACIPLIHKRKIFGAVYLENKSKKHTFSNSHVDLLQIIGFQISTSIEKARDQGKGPKTEEHYRYLFKKKLKQIQRMFLYLLAPKRQHDIRSAINSIIGYAELLKTAVNENPLKDPKTASNHLDEIQHRGRNLLETINTIFDSSKRIVNQSGPANPSISKKELDIGTTKYHSLPTTTQKVTLKIDYALDSWPQLVTALKKAEHQWHSIQGGMIIGEIENFGMHIIRMGDQFQSSAIENWGRKLREHAINLDKKKIKTTLQLFPEIVLKVQKRKPGEFKIDLTT